ncbi:MAG: protein-export chaperone SecB [Alphaproteobacteria bacterium]|nr:protein-export chaperone SecB [Alphaproteobacteria bacterium]
MSDTPTDKKQPKAAEVQRKEQLQAPINILAQYVRDLSFENPNAPESLRGTANNGAAPQMDINIGMDARKIPSEDIEHLYEVVLNLRAIALQGEDALFVAELQYGVAVSLNNIPEENHHPVLLVEVPRLAFPFARQIISDLTVQGGFPPLMLNPVDFQALYMERFKDEIEEARKQEQAAKGEKSTVQ